MIGILLRMEHPTQQHLIVAALLRRLAGDWEGAECLEPSPWSPGGTATGRHAFTGAAGGTAIAQRYAQAVEGGSGLEGHGVWTADPQSGDILWYWFDSIGFPPAAPSRGQWDPASDRLILQKTSPRGTQRAEFAFADGRLRHTVSVRLADAGDEGFRPVLTADYRRCVSGARAAVNPS